MNVQKVLFFMPSLKDTCRNCATLNTMMLLCFLIFLSPRKKRESTVRKGTDCDQPKMYLIQQFSLCFEINESFYNSTFFATDIEDYYQGSKMLFLIQDRGYNKNICLIKR